MAAGDHVLSVLRELERSSAEVAIRFHDGEVYRVMVISTAHAEAGDDVVAEVLTVEAGSIPAGAFMNFAITDVAEVGVGGTNTFADPGA